MMMKVKTGFSTPDGHCEFNGMPFGFKNAPLRVMDLTCGLTGINRFVYLDEIVVTTT